MMMVLTFQHFERERALRHFHSQIMVEQERFYLSTSESERRMRREGKRASMKTTLNPTQT